MKGGESAWIACRPLQPYVWKPIAGGGKRLFSPELKNGVIVQVAAASEYPDIESFGRAIAALPLEIQLAPVPRVRFQSLRGGRIEFTYGEVPRINGSPLDYEHWPLFGGPFLQAGVDSEQLTLTWGKMRRVLDFRTLTVTDSAN
jgi:hypothetical protein